VGTAVSMAVSILCAYGLSRTRSFGHRFFLMAMIFTMFFGGGLIPGFLVVSELHGYDNYWALILPSCLSVFNILIMRGFYQATAQDLIDAARIDGASYLGIYWRIMLPLIRPALAAVAVFEFQAKWNDFMTPLIYLNKSSLYTLSLGLQTFKVEYNTQWGLLMAGSVIFTIPMIVIFFLGQRYFMESVTTTGLKS
jgi:ABC-type glycerol-3-phosphate transport system permease component